MFDASKRESKFDNIYDYLKAYVKVYNQRNDNVKIEMVNYGPSDDYDSYLKAITEINLNNMPDLLLVTGLPYEKIAEKECFTDLYQFIDNDTNMKKDDLFSGPLKAMEYNGGLYWISPEFSVVTFYGRSSIFDNFDNEEIKIEKLFEIWDGFDDNKAVFLAQAYSAADAFEIFLSTGLYKTYIDYKTAACDFDNRRFIGFLELFSTLPNKFPETPLQQSYDVVIAPVLVFENEAMLDYCELFDLYGLVGMNSFSAKDKLAFIGVPWISENTALCHISMPISISASSEHKDEAWQFISSLIYNYERYVGNGVKFPLSKSMLETYMEKRGYYENWELYENGDKSVLPLLTEDYLAPFYSYSGMESNLESSFPPTSSTFLREDYIELLAVIDSAAIPLMTKPHTNPFRISTPEFEFITEEAAVFLMAIKHHKKQLPIYKLGSAHICQSSLNLFENHQEDSKCSPVLFIKTSCTAQWI